MESHRGRLIAVALVIAMLIGGARAQAEETSSPYVALVQNAKVTKVMDAQTREAFPVFIATGNTRPLQCQQDLAAWYTEAASVADTMRNVLTRCADGKSFRLGRITDAKDFNADSAYLLNPVSNPGNGTDDPGPSKFDKPNEPQP